MKAQSRMGVVKRYTLGLLGNWINRILVAFDVLGIVLFFLLAFVPDFKAPWWEPWLVVGIIILFFFVANVRLFAEVEFEKEQLHDLINAYEDTRADICFKKLESYCYVPYSSRYCPFPDLKAEIDRPSGLDNQGLPGWVVLGTQLEGMNQSQEFGRLKLEIVDMDLPSLLVFDETAPGHFFYGHGGGYMGQRVDTIDGWRDPFPARYELPLRIAERDSPHIFVQQLNSLKSYRIEINYWTQRGIDEASKNHLMIVEGDLGELRREICEKWNNEGLGELAKLADCQSSD